MTLPARPADLDDLAQLSARIGADPLLIQGAGGNTSVKDGSTMWIKASGTLLAEALTRDVFVPVDLAAMRASVAAEEERADQPADFALVRDGLRPSIETSLHAVFQQRIVVHAHCVNTLAYAIRLDAESALSARLNAFDWGFVRYAKPGANLAASVQKVLGPQTDVVVLGNHGIIVAAETVAEAGALLERVVAALRASPRRVAPDLPVLASRAGDGYSPLPADHPLHTVARVPSLTSAALAGSLYPDHVIFCGVGAVALDPDETPAQAVGRRGQQGLPMPAFLLVPGSGALIRDGASDGAQALVRCLGDVLSRLSDGSEVNTLTWAENAALLDWDAEKYRQTLDAR